MSATVMIPPRHPDTRSDQFPGLLDAARAGHSEALNDLITRLYPRVERYVHAALDKDVRSKREWLSRRFSTGDVVQDVFRSALTDLSGFRGATEDELFAYLARIVRNRLVDEIRFHEAGRRDGRRTDPVTAFDAATSRSGPATVFESKERLAMFDEALATFEEREQQLLRGRLLDDVGFRELTTALGYSSESATRRAFYATQAKLVVRLRRMDLSDDR